MWRVSPSKFTPNLGESGHNIKWDVLGHYITVLINS